MKKLLSLLLVITLLTALPLLVGCKKVDGELPVRVWTLNGTTGFGMAPLMKDNEADLTALNYEFTVETNAANVREALINETADIGALPTNVASALYNATDGEVVLLAINTYGVLYLVANTANMDVAPTSIIELSGKTVYVPAQNPAFIAQALIDRGGYEDITLDSTTYAEPAALQKAVAAGLVDYAILPEPMVTIAKANAAEGVTLVSSIDLTSAWALDFTDSALVQGCVVARRAFVEEHPNEVAKFLEEYEASINYVIDNPKEASEIIVEMNIFAGKAPVAERAIPLCNLTFLTGGEMQSAMSGFLAAMPVASIGGKLPEADFYYKQ